MKCGHAANSTCNGEPSCAICAGLDPNAYIIDENPPDLTGRIARCSCGKEKPSSYDLPFFEYKGDATSSNLTNLAELQKEMNDICRDQWLQGRNCGKLNPNESENPKKFTREASDRVQEMQDLIRESRTRDRFYCGCMGWD